jgi:catechol 2,3-dioxygenase-like lactoylglutathione lyase family enzyme
MSKTIDSVGSGSSPRPVLQPRCLCRGTMVTVDLTAARRFYEEFLGLQCRPIEPGRMLIRARPGRAGQRPEDHGVIEVRQVQTIERRQNVLNHWGVDVAARADVDRIHAEAVKHKDRYGLRRIMSVRLQHGVYGFYLEDRDSNWWEIQQRDPDSTYAPIFEAGDKYPD